MLHRRVVPLHHKHSASRDLLTLPNLDNRARKGRFNCSDCKFQKVGNPTLACQYSDGPLSGSRLVPAKTYTILSSFSHHGRVSLSGGHTSAQLWRTLNQALCIGANLVLALLPGCVHCLAIMCNFTSPTLPLITSLYFAAPVVFLFLVLQKKAGTYHFILNHSCLQECHQEYQSNVQYPVWLVVYALQARL